MAIVVETVIPDAQAETESEHDAGEQGEQGGEQERGRSTIQFPYLDLNEAVRIAKGVHTEGGNSCQVDQLAARLQEKTDAPKFRQKLGTSKMFGLITFGAGSVALTPLGIRVNDPQQEAAAKAEAFLLVPLYKQVYEQFKGGNLPPLTGLENAMGNMGVAPKQKANARQVFFRSATQAGFFTHGTNRLVPPSVKGNGSAGSSSDVVPPPVIPKPPETPAGKNGGGGGDGGGGELHPLIEGLIRSLPKEGEDWPIDKRAKWLRAAAQNFDLIYPDTGSDSIEIKIQRGTTQ